MAWVATLLAGAGGKLALAGAVIGGLVLIGWLLVRMGEKRGLAKARQSDVDLRAKAEKASGGGYAHARAELEKVDPITGIAAGGAAAGERLRARDPGDGPA